MNVNALKFPGGARIILAVSAVLIIATASKASILIDFESIPGVDPTSYPQSYFPGFHVPAAARLSTQLQSSHGVRFTSDLNYISVVVLQAGHATSGVNGFGGVDSAGNLQYSAPVFITFSMPGNPSAPAVTSMVSIRGDQIASTGSAYLEAFDVDGNSLGSTSTPDVVGGLTLSFSNPFIHSFKLTQDSNQIGYDDLEFADLSPAPTAAVPEFTSVVVWSVIAGMIAMVKGSGLVRT